MMYESSNDMANSLQEGGETSSAFKMAKVSSVSGSNVYLTFYGESSPRIKSYKRLASYSPAVGDTVIVAKLNNSYTILGKVV